MEEQKKIEQDIRVELIPYNFGEPDFAEFPNAIGYQLGSGFLGVIGQDGITIIYPQDRIRQVVITPKIEQE